MGCLQAIFLAKHGFQVEVFEKRIDTRNQELKVGKSINLALSTRGLAALEKVGLHKAALDIAIPMDGRKMHSITGELSYMPYGLPGQCIYSISRWGLNKVLLNHAEEQENVTLHFQHRCVSLDAEASTVTFMDGTSGELVTRQFDRIIGADGAYSMVRQHLMKTDRFNFSQDYLEHGYKELNMPANDKGKHKIDNHVLHIWPRGKFMLIALPNLDGTFTCTLFLPFDGEVSFASLTSPKKVKRFFEDTFPDVLPLIPDLVDQFFQHPTSSLVTIRSNPWYYQDKVLLIGDAAHAIVPFYGQGMNSGFEDCLILDQLIPNYKDNWKGLFKDFTKQRLKDTNAIAELAVYNYQEMRDDTAKPDFLLRKKIERKFAEKYPEKWTPLYSQVTFTTEPYSTALALNKMQNDIMQKVMKTKDIENSWDSSAVENLMLDLLSSY